MKDLLLLVLSLAQLSASPQGGDVKLVLNEEARGGYDVKTFTRILRSKSVVIDDNNFGRHVYYAKSGDRTDGVNLHGRTMKIDRKAFLSTQNCHLPAIKVYCKLILTNLNIDWTRMSFSDLRNPLYSRLAAALYSFLQHKDTTAALVNTITEANPEPIIKFYNETLVPALPKNSAKVRSRRSFSTPVRLVNGGFPGEGRIEVFYNETWGTVCDDGFDVNDSRVICSMLGYTGEQPIPHDVAFYGVGSGTIWLDDLACLGTELSVFSCRPNTVGIHNCGHGEDAGVNCQPSSRPSIRLVNGTRAWIGRVEIMVNGSWGTVCDDLFTNIDARVVCRMLGYTSGNPIYRSSAYYGQGTGTIWLDDVNCNGNEQDIFMCSHPNLGVHNCGHNEDVGIDCNQEEFPIPVKLTNSSYPWEGRLEVLYNGMWMSVCSYKLNSYAPQVVCRMLGYASLSPIVLPSSYFGQGTGSIWSDTLECTGPEPTISGCPRTISGTGICTHIQDVGIRCLQYAPMPVIRLTSSVNPWEGRVEVWNNGTWGTVCHNNFDVADALVVCRMLGYTQDSPVVKLNALYGPGTGAIWFDGVSCLGTEKTIFQCGHNGLGNHICSHFEDVGVNCLPTAPSLPLRLVNGSYWSGRVEAWHNGSWGSVCNVGFDLNDARVVCKMLGYSREQPIIYNSTVYGSGTGYIALSNINCYGSESSVFQCSHSGFGISLCVHEQDVGINCQPLTPTVPVQLINGSYPWEGRVEVWYGGSWGAVCKYNFDEADASVICNMLGFTGDQPFVHKSGFYGHATGNIWLDNVGCLGTETSIYQCPHNEFGTHACDVRDVASINCLPSAPSQGLQLTNGTYPWEGRVEVWYKGEWGTICSDNFDVVDAVVVCSMLGFQRSVPTVDKALAYGPGTGLVLLDEVNCTGGEKNIYACSHSGLGVHNCNQYKDIGINCQPTSPTVPVKLTNGSFPWEGRVEVWYGGSWNAVCKHNFDIADATVICNMLGFTGDQPFVHNSNIYGKTTENASLDNVGCLGTEHSVYQCPHNEFGTYACDVRDVASINCLPSAPSHVLHLTNGTYPWEGRVEVWYNGQWGTICSDSFDVIDGVVICRMLGFQNSEPRIDKALAYGPGTGSILMDEVSCTGVEKNIYSCLHRGLGVHNCNHYKDVGINCQPSAPSSLVKLVNGSNPWEGRVEVWREGSWGTVCQDNFDVKDARVVCRMLGYKSNDPDIFNSDYYGYGNGPISIYDVSCNGNETTITQCPQNRLENYVCEHFDDVGVRCLKNISEPQTTDAPSFRSDDPNSVYYVGGASVGVILILVIIIVVILKRKSQENKEIIYERPEPNLDRIEDTYEDMSERTFTNACFEGIECNQANVNSACPNIYTNTVIASGHGEEHFYENVRQTKGKK